MTIDGFISCFKKASGHIPFDYQIKIAMSEWPDIIRVQTGMGKTAGIVLPWIFKRNYSTDETRRETPRRLIICEPTRVLVEQTRNTVYSFIENLGLPEKIHVHVLWGGEIESDFDQFPETDTIIIGTQDMLISRALNRGYGMSRFRWPIHFAFLNNDCLWVLDEVQLMGVGVATSAQMDAFRKMFGTFGPHKTIWMSATLNDGALRTVDHPAPPEGFSEIRITEKDLSDPHVAARMDAYKGVNKSQIKYDDDSRKYSREIAHRALEVHTEGTLTLILVNTVGRAQSIFKEMQKAELGERVVLLHSHFRPLDKDSFLSRINQSGDLIIVSTQVVEAGADISAKALITELATWPSMVQRLGRCNRKGEFTDAKVEWIDIPSEEKSASPYSPDEISLSRTLMESIENASPSKLTGLDYRWTSESSAVLRRKDILDLFDTTPDLLGNDLDVSRFVRDIDPLLDVNVLWRSFDEDPSKNMGLPERIETCTVPIQGLRKFLEKHPGWTWDYLEGGWVPIGKGGNRSLRPGQIVLLRRSDGGYSRAEGWTGSDKDIPDEIPPAMIKGISDSSDRDPSVKGNWVTLKDHSEDATAEARILSKLVEPKWGQVLESAAFWHDVGKTHPAFQNALGPIPDNGGIWAKSPNAGILRYHTTNADGKTEERKFFRHELASMLAWLAISKPGFETDLIAYLIAAHHGKVRMSIRSIPAEPGPRDERLFARGIWDGDMLLRSAMLDRDITLDLSPMKLGMGSWTGRMLRLRDHPDLGPFRLAYLEALVRVADWRASEKERRTIVG